MEKDAYKITCQILGRTHIFIRKFPSDELLFNHIFVLTMTVLLVFPTILLNTVSIITIIKSSQLKSKLCYFIILIQSVTDLAVGIIGIPLFILSLMTAMGKISNCFLATVAYRSTIFSIGVSMLTLSVLTMDRYIAVLHPYAYSTQVTRRRILIYVLSGTTLMFSATILSLAFEGIIRRVSALFTALFFASTVFVYGRIYLVIRKFTRSETLALPYNPSQSCLTKKKMFFREIKQAKDCFIVVMCFFLLGFVPACVTLVMEGSINKYQLEAVQNCATMLVVSNSSANSVIFFWTKNMLRKEALKMLTAVHLCPRQSQ